MKRLMMSVTLLFLISCLLCLFYGCTSEEGGGQGDEDNVPLLTVMEGGVCDYVIVRSDTDEAATKAAITLRKAIAEKTGITLEITTDWKTNPVHDHEFLIGITEREGNYIDPVDRSMLFDDGYIMKVCGERILLTGDAEEGCVNAVEAFMESYITENGIVVPTTLDVTVNHEFPVKSLKIDGADISGFQILYDSGAGSSVKKAATELQSYIRFCCGAQLEVTNDPTAAGKRIYVHAADEDTENFSYKSDENGIIITGGATRGALYGTYHFLEECVGMRFLASDTEFCIPSDGIDLKALDHSYTQYFGFRDSFLTDYFNAGISAKRMVNSSVGRSIPAELGGTFGFTGRFVHTMTDLVGCEETQQPCLCDEEIYQKALASVMALLEANPDAKLISVSQNDNSNYCTCAKCRAVDEEEGSHAGTMIRFVNRIAEEVEKKYPNVLVHTLAYHYTRQAPKITVPRDNVVVQLCTIECCFNHALNDENCPENVSLKNDIEAWGKICKHIYIWDYVANFRYYLMPFPDFHVLAENMRFFYENNAFGVFEEGAYQGKSGEFGELRAYLLARLLENPYITDEEYDAMINEFMQAYYGGGWEYIRKYYDFIMECGRSREHFTIYDTYMETVGSALFLKNSDQLAAWFDAAEAAADNDRILEHIRRTRISCDYIRLSLIFDSMYYSDDEAKQKAIVEQVEALYQCVTDYDIRIRESGENPIISRFDYKPLEW